MRLEVLKKTYFLNYNNVERYLEQNRQKYRDQQISGPVIKTLSLMTQTNHLNDNFSPLSSSAITNSPPVVEFLKPKCDRNKSRFFESFANKYFDQMTTIQKMKLERESEIERERSKQARFHGNEVQRSPRRVDCLTMSPPPLRSSQMGSSYYSQPNSPMEGHSSKFNSAFRMNDRLGRQSVKLDSVFKTTQSSISSEVQCKQPSTAAQTRPILMTGNSPARQSYDVRSNIMTPASLFPRKQQTMSRLGQNHFAMT